MSAEKRPSQKAAKLEEPPPSSWASILREAELELERWVEHRRQVRHRERASQQENPTGASKS